MVPHSSGAASGAGRPFGGFAFRIVGRIALVFLATAIVVVGLVYAVLQFVLPEHPRNQLSERLVIHVLGEIEQAPGPEAYAALARELDVDLLVVDEQGEWRSSPDMPSADYFLALAADIYAGRTTRVALHDNMYLLVRLDGRLYVLGGFVADLSGRGQLALLLGVLALPLVIFAALWTMRRVISPLKPLQLALGRLGAGELDLRLGSHSRGDIGLLSRDIDEMAAALEELERSKREMLVAIGHEFSSPIARVLFQAERIENPELREKITANLVRVNLLLRTMITAEAMGRRGAMQRTEPCPFPDDLRRLTEDLGEGRARFVCAQSDMTIYVNPMAVELLLSNFISNALRYAGDSPATVSASHAADMLTIEVCDRGPGIGSEFLKRLGAPFMREDPARRFETGGLGLGLYLCKRLTEGAGGRLEFENRPGGGLCVRTTLPCVAINRNALKAQDPGGGGAPAH